MRKNLVVALGVAVIFAAASTTALAVYSAATLGVSGSRHDINQFAKENSTYGVTADAQERVCAFCHTPHHAITDATVDYLPLWSHDLTTVPTYTAYASNTLDATITDPLLGPSRLCMSCHDGVIAVDAHYGLAGTLTLIGDNFSTDPRQSGAVGKDGNLANDHPIGFDYDAAQVLDKDSGRSGLKLSTSLFQTTAGSSAITIKDVLYENVKGEGKKFMTCATCHEVHNKDNVVQTFVDTTKTGSVNYFLYGSQSGSKICLSCHDK